MGPAGASGAAGAGPAGPHGATGQQGADGPAGPTASRSVSSGAAVDVSSAATVIDLSSNPLAVPFAGRLMATATVQLRNPSADPREARCKLQILNALDPQATRPTSACTYATDLPGPRRLRRDGDDLGRRQQAVGDLQREPRVLRERRRSRFRPSARTCRSGPPTSRLLPPTTFELALATLIAMILVSDSRPHARPPRGRPAPPTRVP